MTVVATYPPREETCLGYYLRDGSKAHNQARAIHFMTLGYFWKFCKKEWSLACWDWLETKWGMRVYLNSYTTRELRVSDLITLIDQLILFRYLILFILKENIFVMQFRLFFILIIKYVKWSCGYAIIKIIISYHGKHLNKLHERAKI